MSVAKLTIIALRGIKLVEPGDDLGAIALDALATNGLVPEDGDVLVVAQKIVSKAEGRYVDVATVEPSERAIALAAEVDKDPRFVEVVLSESARVVRHRPGLLIVEHRLGFVMANAGIDHSNVSAVGGERVLLLPKDPDRSARTLREHLIDVFGTRVAVIISDSFGRAWRKGTVGVALGAAGLPAVIDLRGRPDLFGRALQVTETGFADEIAAAAGLLMGQADEAVPMVLVRGLGWSAPEMPAAALIRPAEHDLFSMSVLALSGGIGGAKLALGLYRVLPPGALTVVANTGDDFEHLGLSISPDIDTLLYTLAGIDNPELGWGRRNETWTFMVALETLGGETWFKLGDGDLATHVERTRRLAAGESLSQITDDFRRRLGIPTRILPMSDDPVRTRLNTEDGWLDFQDYFVRRRSSPVVRAIYYRGAAEAQPHPDFLAMLKRADLDAVVICPSNPFLSIDPILSLPGVCAALQASHAPVIAVSPIIGGNAVKGPTAKIMAELRRPVSAAAVARHYADIVDIYIADEADAEAVAQLDIPVRLTRTLMLTLDDREALAREVLAAVGRGL